MLIYKVDNGVFYSYLYMKTEETILRIDARTSDAVALALRMDAPIFIYDDILEAECLKTEHSITPTQQTDDAAADAAAVGMRLRMLEVILGMPGDGNTFMTTFDTLDGVALEGVWNKPLCRVEF